MNPDELSLPLTLLLFGAGALVIAVAGARLAAIADHLSDLLHLIRREQSGVGNIGFESAAVLVFYLAVSSR